jgi:hypothetical protein
MLISPLIEAMIEFSSLTRLCMTGAIAYVKELSDFG